MHPNMGYYQIHISVVDLLTIPLKVRSDFSYWSVVNPYWDSDQIMIIDLLSIIIKESYQSSINFLLGISIDILSAWQELYFSVPHNLSQKICPQFNLSRSVMDPPRSRSLLTGSLIHANSSSGKALQNLLHDRFWRVAPVTTLSNCHTLQSNSSWEPLTHLVQVNSLILYQRRINSVQIGKRMYCLLFIIPKTIIQSEMCDKENEPDTDKEKTEISNFVSCTNVIYLHPSTGWPTDLKK